MGRGTNVKPFHHDLHLQSPCERTEASLELAFLGKSVLQTLLSNYSQENMRFVWDQM